MAITVVVTESEVELWTQEKAHYYKQIFINNSQLSLHWKVTLAPSDIFEWPSTFHWWHDWDPQSRI